jgi:hypothetical protein
VKEGGHLLAGDRIVGAELCGGAPLGNPLSLEPLDVGGKRIVGWNVDETGSCLSCQRHRHEYEGNCRNKLDCRTILLF